jgi:hypothetical protein
MDPVRTGRTASPSDLYRSVEPAESRPGWRPSVLDLICVVGIIALGVIVALVGRGVEKL